MSDPIAVPKYACATQKMDMPPADLVNYPPHYTSHPSGVECITITEWMNFCLGNALKYIWRAGLKGNSIEDLEKARWYVDREIARLRAVAEPADVGATDIQPGTTEGAIPVR